MVSQKYLDMGIDFGQTEDTTKNIIKVIGVGGGGCNAVKNMYSEGIVNVSFAVCNTDSQSLSKSLVPVKIMLGKNPAGNDACRIFCVLSTSKCHLFYHPILYASLVFREINTHFHYLPSIISKSLSIVLIADLRHGGISRLLIFQLEDEDTLPKSLV